MPKRVRIAPGLYQRGASYSVGYSLDGKWTMQVLSGATNVTEAKRLQREIMSRLDKGEVVAPSSTTLASVYAAWFEQLDRKPRTKKAYSTAWRIHVEPSLGRRRVQNVNVRDCIQFISSMKKSSASTTNVGIAVLSSVLGHAITEGLITTNPMRSVPRGSRPRARRKDIRILSDQELYAFLATLPQPYRDVAYFVSRTGLRQAEALGLVWGDVSLPDRSLLVSAQKAINADERVPTKNSTPRAVPLDPETVLFLHDHRVARFAVGCARAEDFVFGHATGEVLKEGSYGRAVRLAARKVGLDGFTGHALRHRYGSLLFERGVPAKTCATVMGHSVQEFLRTYSHVVSVEEQNELVRQALSQ